MSEENKCNGLDCAICAETKCPNEKPIINGIDVSEEIRYCNNCSNLGLDFKTGKFYCGLSNRKDELPEILSCENFSSNCYIKCLQKENEELKKLKNMYFTFYKAKHDDIKGIFFKYRQALEEIKEILQKPDLSSVDENNLMTAEELLVVVDSNRQTKLINIQDKINEVLNDRD